MFLHHIAGALGKFSCCKLGKIRQLIMMKFINETLLTLLIKTLRSV